MNQLCIETKAVKYFEAHCKLMGKTSAGDYQTISLLSDLQGSISIPKERPSRKGLVNTSTWQQTLSCNLLIFVYHCIICLNLFIKIVKSVS